MIKGQKMQIRYVWIVQVASTFDSRWSNYEAWTTHLSADREAKRLQKHDATGNGRFRVKRLWLRE
jgi:hypothetical protein